MGKTCNLTAAIWLLDSFLNKRIRKSKYYYFLFKPIEKRKNNVTMTNNRKKSPFLKMSRDNEDKKGAKKQQFLLFLVNHGLQYYCLLREDNFDRLCGRWKASKQIWTIFLVQN